MLYKIRMKTHEKVSGKLRLTKEVKELSDITREVLKKEGFENLKIQFGKSLFYITYSKENGPSRKDIIIVTDNQVDVHSKIFYSLGEELKFQYGFRTQQPWALKQSWERRKYF